MTVLNREIYDGALRVLKDNAWIQGDYVVTQTGLNNQVKAYCVLGAIAKSLGADVEEDGSYAFFESIAELDAMIEQIITEYQHVWSWAYTLPDKYNELLFHVGDYWLLTDREVKMASCVIEWAKHKDCRNGAPCGASATFNDGETIGTHGDFLLTAADYRINVIAAWNDFPNRTFDEVATLLTSV